MFANAMAKAAFSKDSSRDKKMPFMFNPAELTVSTGVNYKEKSGGGAKEKDKKKSQNSELQFNSAASSTLSMNIVFDTADKVNDSALSALKDGLGDKMTGLMDLFQSDAGLMEKGMGAVGALMTPASDSKHNVISATSCGAIESLVYPSPDEDNHPPNIWFEWGNMNIPCVMEKVVSKYTMFSSQGTPLRAELSLNLRVGHAAKKEAAVANPLSGGSGGENPRPPASPA